MPQSVGHIFLLMREPRVGWRTDVAGGEVGDQRVLAGPAVAVTFVASCLTSEQIVSLLLLWRELRLFRQYRVELRSKRGHLGRSFVARDRLRHLIERGADPAAINRAQMYRQPLTGLRH